jgi:hypothetical protein
MYKLFKNNFILALAPGGISRVPHRLDCWSTCSATRSADRSRGISSSYGVKVLTVSRRRDCAAPIVIHSIFDEYLCGLSLASIAKRLNTEGSGE